MTYKRDLLQKKEEQGDTSFSRRKFLSIVGLGGSAAVAAFILKDRIGKSVYEALDPIFMPEEEVRFLKVRRDILAQNYGNLVKFKSTAIFAEYRGSIFELYPIQMERNDRGSSNLIYRANELSNPGTSIKGDLADRASDLFNILAREHDLVKKLDVGKIRTFKLKNVQIPDIKVGEVYQVPVYRAYNSLEQIAQTKNL